MPNRHSYLFFAHLPSPRFTTQKVSFMSAGIQVENAHCGTEVFELPAPHSDGFLSTIIPGVDLERGQRGPSDGKREPEEAHSKFSSNSEFGRTPNSEGVELDSDEESSDDLKSFFAIPLFPIGQAPVQITATVKGCRPLGLNPGRRPIGTREEL
jgi:hypothetical protein